MVTPGIFFSIGVDRRSNKPEAEVPTRAILPSKNSGLITPEMTSDAETVVIFLTGVK